MIKDTCPCCGAKRESGVPTYDDIVDVVRARTGSIRFVTVIERLAQAKGKPVTKENLVLALFGGDPDGGPDDAEMCLNVAVSRNRAILKDLGWKVSGLGHQRAFVLHRVGEGTYERGHRWN